MTLKNIVILLQIFFNLYITYKSFFQGITYPCDVCDYVAARPDALKRHKKGKHEEKKFLCDQCQFRAHSAIKLSQHKLTAHVGIRYPCNMCDFQASKLAKLKEHKMTAHDGASFPCDECEKVFPSPKGLKDHKAVHRSGPKFQCEECGFSTTVVESLQTHIDSVHKGNKLIIIQIMWRREYFLKSFFFRSKDETNLTSNVQFFIFFSWSSNIIPRGANLFTKRAIYDP